MPPKHQIQPRLRAVLHVAGMGGITLLLVLCMVYPFLPGEYDGLAATLSFMAQFLGAAGLLFVPIGALWLVYEFRKQARKKRNLAHKDRGYHFAIASMIVASLIAVALSVGAFASVGLSFGLAIFALWVYVVVRLLPRLKRLKQAEAGNFNPAPLYLVFIPIALLLSQLMLAGPATAFSRNYAIAESAELIGDIEEYHARQGSYPRSLLAVWKDYDSSVVGIERYHYAPNGDAYNLFFEQPRFLFDNFGTREFVVYNKLDQHIMLSHASWFLIFTPEQMQATQGWYAVNDTAIPHWKYFWFD